MDTFFTANSPNKRLKAVDTIVFMFLFPFIFQDAFNTDSDDNSDMNFIPRLMVELNFYLLLFFSREVPSDDIPKHKDNFIHLMNYIEDLYEKHSFLKECFFITYSHDSSSF